MPTRSTSRIAARAHFDALSAAASSVDRFLADPSPRALPALVRRLHSLEAKRRARLDRTAPPPVPIVCAPGCTVCCHQNVAVSAPEVLAIADHLRSTLPAPDLADLSARITESAALLQGKGCSDRFALKVGCPLLVEGLCLVYSLRPLACRGDHSLDSSACQAAFDGNRSAQPPSHEPYRAVTSGLLWGVVDALQDAGLNAGPLEFTQALSLALRLSNATESWQRGEGIFEGSDWID